MAHHITRHAMTVLAGLILAVGPVVARDDGRGERVSGDDDPIIVSRSAALPDAGIAAFDPEITGSIGKVVLHRNAQRCARVLLYPERPPEQQ